MHILEQLNGNRQRLALSEALRYAEQGWRVVPLHGVTLRDGEPCCTCRLGPSCGDIGKHPRITGWQNEATADEATIERWLSRWPDANIGVALGPSSGIVDVEYDDEEGRATAERLLGECFTPSFRSQRSTHRLFRFPSALAMPKAVIKSQGLEIRLGLGSKGAQSVFPPSVHASGVDYAWLPGLSLDDVTLQPFPRVLRELIEGEAGCNGNAPADGDAQAFVMLGDLATHPGSPEGERYDTLCRLVGSHLAHRGPDGELLPMALAWAERCKPPFSAEETQKVVLGLASQEMAKGESNGRPKAIQPAPPQPLAIRPLSTVERKPVRWLWRYRIPLGRLTVLAGDGSVGKTMLACDIASRLSRGEPLPGDTEGEPSQSLFITAEDGDGDLLDRIEATGGDTSQVYVLEEGHDFDSYRSCIAKLEQAVSLTPELKLVIFDTLPDFIGDADDHKNSAVRQALRSLIRFASQHDIAAVGICHFRKAGDGKAGDRLLGSVAYRNLPRSVLYLLHDPDDSDRRILWHEKHNLSPQADTLAVAFDAFQGRDNPPRLAWEPEAVFIDDIGRYLDAKATRAKETKTAEAGQWLTLYLAEGPKHWREIIEAGKPLGYSQATIYRAADAIGVVKGEGNWSLPNGVLNSQLSRDLRIENGLPKPPSVADSSQLSAGNGMANFQSSEGLENAENGTTYRF